MAIATLIETVKSIIDLPEEQERSLLKKSRSQVLRKRESFIKEGRIPKEFAYVKKGLFRYFYSDEKGHDYTKGFFPEKTFLSAYTSMINREPSLLTIEALEDSEIVVIDYHKWELLRKQHHCWDKFLVALLGKGYAAKVKRERELLLFDAKTRYDLFREEYRHLENRIPQHLIASFLGITPVALSRIRKKMGLINTG